LAPPAFSRFEKKEKDMSHAHRWSRVIALASAFIAPAAMGGDDDTTAAAAPAASNKEAATPRSAPSRSAPLLALKPVDAKTLAGRRGGADVLNDMRLKGVVSDNKAVNVSTGNNVIADGSFAGTAGLPMVVQNTGNNVLIQNATIVNVQVK
jgi:hypothetical protein